MPATTATTATSRVSARTPGVIAAPTVAHVSTNFEPRSRLCRRQTAYPTRSINACVVPMMPIQESGAPMTRT